MGQGHAQDRVDGAQLEQPVALTWADGSQAPLEDAHTAALGTVAPRIGRSGPNGATRVRADGSRTIILIADSQDQYMGLLNDWFKVLIVRL